MVGALHAARGRKSPYTELKPVFVCYTEKVPSGEVKELAPKTEAETARAHRIPGAATSQAAVSNKRNL